MSKIPMQQWYPDSHITQKRILKDYKKACETSKKNAENGKVGGLKTAEKWKSSQATAPAQH